MKQLYVQRFQIRSTDREAIDKAWEHAHQVFGRSGNWGDVPSGVKTILALGAAWGGVGVIEVTDAAAFDAYQAFHQQHYAHVVDITFTPVADFASLMPDVYGK